MSPPKAYFVTKEERRLAKNAKAMIKYYADKKLRDTPTGTQRAAYRAKRALTADQKNKRNTAAKNRLLKLKDTPTGAQLKAYRAKRATAARKRLKKIKDTPSGRGIAAYRGKRNAYGQARRDKKLGPSPWAEEVRKKRAKKRTALAAKRAKNARTQRQLEAMMRSSDYS